MQTFNNPHINYEFATQYFAYFITLAAASQNHQASSMKHTGTIILG